MHPKFYSSPRHEIEIFRLKVRFKQGLFYVWSTRFRPAICFYGVKSGPSQGKKKRKKKKLYTQCAWTPPVWLFLDSSVARRHFSSFPHLYKFQILSSTHLTSNPCQCPVSNTILSAQGLIGPPGIHTTLKLQSTITQTRKCQNLKLPSLSSSLRTSLFFSAFGSPPPPTFDPWINGNTLEDSQDMLGEKASWMHFLWWLSIGAPFVKLRAILAFIVSSQSYWLVLDCLIKIFIW